MSSIISDSIKKAAQTADILKKMNDEKNQCQSQYDANAVQKLIDQRQAEEAMANMGLTGSGQSLEAEKGAEAKQKSADAEIRKKQKAEEDSLHRSLMEQLLKNI